MVGTRRVVNCGMTEYHQTRYDRVILV